jgi:hypothetical protein
MGRTATMELILKKIKLLSHIDSLSVKPKPSTLKKASTNMSKCTTWCLEGVQPVLVHNREGLYNLVHNNTALVVRNAH